MRGHGQELPADLEERISRAAHALDEDSRVVFAYLFGGLARGRRTSWSDVDIAVYLKDAAERVVAKLDLLGMVTQIIGTEDVDLVILNDAPTSLTGRIQQSACVLVDEDPAFRHRYESLARRQFFDFQIRERAVLARRFGLGGPGTGATEAGPARSLPPADRRVRPHLA